MLCDSRYSNNGFVRHATTGQRNSPVKFSNDTFALFLYETCVWIRKLLTAVVRDVRVGIIPYKIACETFRKQMHFQIYWESVIPD